MLTYRDYVYSVMSDYNAAQVAVVTIPEQMETERLRRESLRAAKTDGDRVQGGEGQTDDAWLTSIAREDYLKARLDMSRRVIETVEELLRVSNIMVNDNQIVLPGRAEKVTPYMVVTVRDAKAVELTDGGKTRIVMLACGTVEDALKLAGIALGSEDKLSVDRSAQVEAIDSLTIRRTE